jgi:hypothetical protein
VHCRVKTKNKIKHFAAKVGGACSHNCRADSVSSQAWPQPPTHLPLGAPLASAEACRANLVEHRLPLNQLQGHLHSQAVTTCTKPLIAWWQFC